VLNCAKLDMNVELLSDDLNEAKREAEALIYLNALAA
jgi:hypothetical protein